MTGEATPEAKVRKYLTTHRLAFTGLSHSPVYTCEEAERLVPPLDYRVLALPEREDV